LTAIIAVICGHVARRRIAANPARKGKELATFGLILGYLQLALLGGGVLVSRDTGLMLQGVQSLRTTFEPPAPSAPDPNLAAAPFVLITPEGFDLKTPIPCVFWIHGYGSSGTDAFEGSEAFYQGIANRQQVAFIGVTAGRIISAGEDKGGHTWAESAKEDQEQLETILKRHAPQITPDWGRCVLFGFSQGGKVAGMLMAHHPDKYEGMLMFSPGSVMAELDIVPKGRRLDGKKALCICMAESPFTTKLTDYYAESLRTAGVQARRLNYPEIDKHQFPPDFEERFEEWLVEVRSKKP
jgi:predicted esterase